MATPLPRKPTHGSAKELGKTVRLEYAGKQNAESVISGQGVQFQKLVQLPRVSAKESFAVPSEGDIYFGDNLPLLKSLSLSHRGKIDLIYIDPPFASGGVYESRDQRQAYSDLFHGSAYIEFIRQRLLLLKELMSQTGSIWLHIDETMLFAIKLIMDEIFGEGNFRNLVVRKKCSSKNSSKRSFGSVVDYVLFYSKSDSYYFTPQYDRWTDEWVLREYPYVDDRGRRFKKVPIHAPGVRRGETGKSWRGKMPPAGKHWQHAPAALDTLDQQGDIYWSANGNPRRKVYFENSKGVLANNLWTDFRDPFNQNVKITGYPTEKNLSLLSRIICAGSPPGGLVLDCFMGSGTSLAAAFSNKRRFIGMDNSPVALQATLHRFYHGTEAMGDFVGVRKHGASDVGMLTMPPSISVYSDPAVANIAKTVISSLKTNQRSAG